MSRNPRIPHRGDPLVVPVSTSTEFRRHEDGRVVGVCVGLDLPPAGMELETTPTMLPACQAFTPDELAARLAYYSRRAMLGRPLFTFCGDRP